MEVNINLDFMKSLIGEVPFPRIVKVEQSFDPTHLELDEIEESTYEQLLRSPRIKAIKPGERIAITCGSRGINGYVEMTRAAVRAVKNRGGEPFLVPAMGSHGGATAGGQKAMVESLGVTEESVGAPIVSSMETDQITTVMEGRPVFIDRNANQADGIILINRVKCHTSFRGRYESGLMKMMAIGLGKREGAQHYHQTGYDKFHVAIEEVGKAVLANAKILCGIAQVENGFGKAVKVEVLEPERIVEREPELLELANSYLSKMCCDQLDVCCIQEIGKNISGTGFDHNVVGRFPGHPEIGTQVTRVVVLDLTEISHGNASSIGRTDIITQRLLKKADPAQFYPNSVTSTSLDAAKIPIIVSTDKDAVALAIKTSLLVDFSKARLAFIENTKNMKTLYVSENVVPEAVAHGAVAVGEPFEIPFDEKGNLCLKYQ